MADINLDTLSSRLTHALDQLEVSQAELARRIHVKRQAIQYLCASGTDKTKFAYDIAEALSINVDWLVTGNGEMQQLQSPEKQLLLNQSTIPILRWNQINDWLAGNTEQVDLKKWFNTSRIVGNNAFSLQLKDNSMYPRFDSNTLIVVDPNVTVTPSNYVIAYIRRMNDSIFRQYVIKKQNKILIPYNEIGYKQIELEKDDKILGSVVEARWFNY